MFPQFPSKVYFPSMECQTFYWSNIQGMTVNDSIKCRCAHSGMTGQVGSLSASVSFFSSPPPPCSFTCPIFRVLFGSCSLRTADAFPVIASLPLRERSDDRKCVCCSQAMALVPCSLLRNCTEMFAMQATKTLDSNIHRIRLYPVGKAIGSHTTSTQFH